MLPAPLAMHDFFNKSPQILQVQCMILVTSSDVMTCIRQIGEVVPETNITQSLARPKQASPNQETTMKSSLELA